MNDIRPSKRSVNESQRVIVPPIVPASSELSSSQPTKLAIAPRRSIGRILGVVSTVLALLVVTIVFCLFFWYRHELQPVSSGKEAVKVRVLIKSGTTPHEIAIQLEQARVIRSSEVFDIYTRLHHARNNLQAGTYLLSPTMSTPEVVTSLTSGNVESFTITFLPGATLMEDKQVLLKAGYSSEEIDVAFAKKYDSLLFSAKPASAGLEGYIFGDTYKFGAGASVEDILNRVFEEYAAYIQKYDLVSLFKKQKLTLYQGITLASIVQREVSAANANEPTADQEQVVQVFMKRLHDGTPLGSDVTYKYAAKAFGLEDSPFQDSKYNTRKIPGLPPGPIATPGGGALRAVAHPAKGTYEYFLAGDNGKIYFSHTYTEHQANIKKYCSIGCSE